MKTFDITTFENLEKALHELKATFSKKQIVLLSGPMGSGKTTAIGKLVESYGGRWSQSPTFAIHQTYKTRAHTIDHIDLFRLQNDRDLESTGFWDVFDSSEGLVLIEWGDRLEVESLPSGWDIMCWEFQKNSEKRALILLSKSSK